MTLPGKREPLPRGFIPKKGQGVAVGGGVGSEEKGMGRGVAGSRKRLAMAVTKGKFPQQTQIREREKKENWGPRGRSVVEQGSPPIRFRACLGQTWGRVESNGSLSTDCI